MKRIKTDEELGRDRTVCELYSELVGRGIKPRQLIRDVYIAAINVSSSSKVLRSNNYYIGKLWAKSESETAEEWLQSILGE